EIPDDTMNIGEQVTVIIRVESDRGNSYALNGGEIGGYPLTGLSRVNETTYISGFTVSEGGNDYAAHQNIPVTGLQLYNGLLPGEVYNQPIIQGNDLLDANRPVILGIAAQSSGAQNIGSVILLRISADQAGYIFTQASHVNNVPLSASTIQVTSLGAGDYDLSYMVGEGDNDVGEGNLELEIIAGDIAGNFSTPFTSLSSNDLSIDASSPAITRAYISSTDTIVQVGETLEIMVEADQSGYSSHENTRINDVPVGPNLIFTDLGNGLYHFSYTVSETDGTVSKGNLAVNIVLQDPAPYENTSLAFTALDPNNITILTERPSASVSGSTDICLGGSATVTITLGGMPPWEFDIFDGTSTLTVSNITDPVYQFTAQPELTINYTVPRLIDGTGRSTSGFGNALITVHPLPDVEIFNLLEIYDIEESPVELDYSPAGGTFTGPGITNPPWTFIPSLAGTQDSPHEIIYTYTDENTCSSSDTVIVQVMEAGGYISFERTVACFNDLAFYITGHNDGNTIGTISVQPTPPEGAFSDLDSNRAVIRPHLYNLSENLDVQVSYTFTDTLGDEYTLLRILTIEKLEDVRMDAIPDIYFCQNDAPITLTGIPETGYFSGPGVVWNALLGYQFDPSFAGLDTNVIRYIYTSVNHCSVSDSATMIVYDAPFADFTTLESCIPGDGGLVQFVNRSDTGLSLDELWSWDFGDIFSGENNYSNLRNPSHYYDKPGTWTIRLDVNSGNGCSDFIQKTMAIQIKPRADFLWNSNCLTDDPIVFEGQETVDYPDTVSSRMWKIYRGNTEIFSSDTNQPSYYFQSEGSFRVSYSIVTNTGCTDTTDKILTLSPTYILTENPYFEDFE
ncbi:MAG: PKD domain-containing protein, partial [Bacteroidales bacterium]|nr:PKD domain-containing protein [Bacteroidales bacterium]